MRTTPAKTLSIVPIVATRVRTQRTTLQSLHILTFIHRFRHVTTRHIQLSLRHASDTPTHKQLSHLLAKGLVARHYTKADKAANKAASYYLTPEGRSLLQAKYPERKYRAVRSLQADATATQRARVRHHTLADVYAHLKQHHDGFFELFSTFDMAGLSSMPDTVPDGFVIMKQADGSPRYYYVEIYGRGRSTQVQDRRLHNYLQHAESSVWQSPETGPTTDLLLVVPDAAVQKRLRYQLKESLQECISDSFKIYTATAASLTESESAIWHSV